MLSSYSFAVVHSTFPQTKMEESCEITSPEIQQKRESCWSEILKRVPAAQLGVCLCVSKKWYNLITCASFISSHISITLRQSSKLFMVRSFCKPNPLKNPLEICHICYDNDKQPLGTLENLETLTKKTILCPFKTSKGLHFRFVGSVNGVVFLSDDVIINTFNYILWNPLLNCFVQLPKPKARFKTIGAYMDVFGFGYDGEKDDFKVIRLVYPERSDGLDATPPKAELYSVKEGEWRWVSADCVEYCVTNKEWSQCFLKGSAHWVAYERESEELDCRHKSNLLLLFNVEKEKFLMMKLPQELREVCPFALTVSERQGMLCVDHNVRTAMFAGGLVHCNLWVKKEYNKGTSWCKVASIDLRDINVSGALYWRKNLELVVSTKDNELASYDPMTGTVVMLERGNPALYEAFSFVESLAFLNKDCKNRRRFIPLEEDDGSNNGEELTPEKSAILRMRKHKIFVNQLRNFRREF